MFKFLFLILTAFGFLFGFDASSTFTSTCTTCHGSSGQNIYLGVTKKINTLDSATIKQSLIGYKNGTLSQYGSGATMTGQLSGINESDFDQLSAYISTLGGNTISINQDWNLVSANITDMTSLDALSDIKIIWSYEDSVWMAYSSDSLIQTELSQESLPAIDSLINEHGFWLNSSSQFSLNIEQNSVSVNQLYHVGWSLVGSISTYDVNTVSCDNSELKVVWVYENDAWKIYTPTTLQTNYEGLSSIVPNMGFWVLCQ